jgi:hypothetical protein
MRRLARAFLAALIPALVLGACGYTLRGQGGHHAPGTGHRTIRLLEVNQPTIHMDLGYILRSQLRDEINARGLAAWKDSGQADFGLIVDVTSFTVDAYGHSRSENLLYSASMSIVFRLVDGRTNQPAWNSGQIAYSERYENVDEEDVLRELAALIIQRGVDRMQQFFSRSAASGNNP